MFLELLIYMVNVKMVKKRFKTILIILNLPPSLSHISPHQVSSPSCYCHTRTCCQNLLVGIILRLSTHPPDRLDFFRTQIFFGTQILTPTQTQPNPTPTPTQPKCGSANPACLGLKKFWVRKKLGWTFILVYNFLGF